MELPSQKILPAQALGNAGGVVFVQSDAPAHRLKGRQLRPRPFPVQRMVLVGEVEAQHRHAEQQRGDTQRQVAAAKKRGGGRAGAGDPTRQPGAVRIHRPAEEHQEVVLGGYVRGNVPSRSRSGRIRSSTASTSA